MGVFHPLLEVVPVWATYALMINVPAKRRSLLPGRRDRSLVKPRSLDICTHAASTTRRFYYSSTRFKLLFVQSLIFVTIRDEFINWARCISLTRFVTEFITISCKVNYRVEKKLQSDNNIVMRFWNNRSHDRLPQILHQQFLRLIIPLRWVGVTVKRSTPTNWPEKPSCLASFASHHTRVSHS